MGGGKHFNVSINPRRPTWSLLRLTFKLREVGGGHISMRPFLTLGSQSPSRSEWYRKASGEFGEDLHDADLCRRVAHKAISKRERRMQGGSAQHRPMPPRGPQGRLRMSGECGESLHNADPYHRVAHKAVSDSRYLNEKYQHHIIIKQKLTWNQFNESSNTTTNIYIKKINTT